MGGELLYWCIKEVAPSKWLTIIVLFIIFKALHSDFILFMLFGKLLHNIWYHKETFFGIFTPKTTHLVIFGITFFSDYLRVWNLHILKRRYWSTFSQNFSFRFGVFWEISSIQNRVLASSRIQFLTGHIRKKVISWARKLQIEFHKKFQKL